MPSFITREDSAASNGSIRTASIALSAKTLHIAKSRIAIVGGARERMKTVEIADGGTELATVLDVLGDGA